METSFLMIPRAFLKDEKYSGLSPHAMVLYGLMRDRSLMSEKRPAFNDDDGVYIIFRRDDICAALGCGHDKAGKILRELETYELVSVKRQGRNKPNKYYVENLLPDICISDSRTSSNLPTENGNTDIPGIGKQDSSYIDLNSYKDYSYKEMNQSICRFDPDEVEAFIKDNVEYRILIQQDFRTRDSLPELINIMVDAICSTSQTIMIGGEEYPRSYVRKRFLNFDSGSMEYVLDRLKRSTSKVENIRSYLLTVLFNAPVTMNNYYEAEVRHDFGY